MIEIKIDAERVLSTLDRLQRGAANASPVMAQIAGVMHDAVEENFAQQGRPKWVGLKPPVPKRRIGGMILQDSGQLASSISESHDSNSAAVGTNKKYAAIHQFGGQAGRGRKSTIPARPFLSLTPEDEDRIVGKVSAYLKSVVG